MRETPTEIWGQTVRAYHIDGETQQDKPQTLGCYKCASTPSSVPDPLSIVFFVNGTTLCALHARSETHQETK